MERSEIIAAVATELTLERPRVEQAVDLLDAGNTIPFIARYRKEVTDSLDEEELRQLAERLRYRRNLEKRRETIRRSMAEQDVLTPERAAELDAADTLHRLEDLYRPFKPQRRTRATMAREKGLEPLAELILTQSLEEEREQAASDFLNGKVASTEEAYAGARDIVAEVIADDPRARGKLRKLAQRQGQLLATDTVKEKDPQGLYRTYYDFAAALSAIRPHQVMALNRAERAEVLKLGLEVPAQAAVGILSKYYSTDYGSPFADDLLAAREDGFQRLLFPAIEREARSALAALADAHASGVFATNLRSLLLQPPLRGQTVLGIDPGIRTGCKVAVVDPTGKVLDTAVIYPDRHPERAKAKLRRLGKHHQVTVIAIGNGTASRETEQLVAGLLHQEGAQAKYTIVSEAGASVYSASQLARRELPELDVTLRGAVSIARRLQDPLAELIKIDPQAIGVGLYQHDVNQTTLAEALDAVVESVVHSVGIDLNTASAALLQHISGIGPKTAEAVVVYRDEHGPFPTRAALQEVRGIGPKTFEQAAGFLRVPGGKDPLDDTSIHPESYPVARALLARLKAPLGAPQLAHELATLRNETGLAPLAAELGSGLPTLEDILDALARPGRDPRDALAGPLLRGDILKIDDLHEGLQLRGTVRNVVDFGAFVDIGVKRAGLIHISQMGNEYISNPHDKVSVGDVVKVTVIKVDLERGRIGLKLAE
ncbi:MAG: Tex family protein [Chloroflexota bacterium]|nr:Tex family protein [Chloroflexota bacterium]